MTLSHPIIKKDFYGPSVYGLRIMRHIINAKPQGYNLRSAMWHVCNAYGVHLTNLTDPLNATFRSRDKKGLLRYTAYDECQYDVMIEIMDQAIRHAKLLVIGQLLKNV